MVNHWWWRPGWAVGRRFYTWHLTFDDAPDVTRLVHEYDAHLDLPGLDVIPERWLHLTMQGIGFTHQVPTADVDEIVSAARARLAHLEPFQITLGPADVDPEVVRLTVTPTEPVTALRHQLRGAIADVWGNDRVPEDEADFTPHVSLAYSSRDADLQPILDAATTVAPTPATMTVHHADLIQLHRDHQQYEWTTYAEVPLGPNRT
jgi:2'-5' RNA ligase